jgi:hypothetical protein
MISQPLFGVPRDRRQAERGFSFSGVRNHFAAAPKFSKNPLFTGLHKALSFTARRAFRSNPRYF